MIIENRPVTIICSTALKHCSFALIFLGVKLDSSLCSFIPYPF